MISPLNYTYLPTSLTQVLPTDEWVAESLTSFVRGEFGSDPRKAQQTFEPFGEFRDTWVTRELPHLYLEECERSLVYGPHLANLLARPGMSSTEKLYKIACDPLIGNRQNSRNVSLDLFDSAIQRRSHSLGRLQFILPAFPFKDQNPFRTEADPGSVDFAELALLIRLHAWVLAYYQVDPAGADFVIVSDGSVYANIFGVDASAPNNYISELRHWRNELNLERTISIVDLGDLITRCDGGTDKFQVVSRHIEGILGRVRSDTDSDGSPAKSLRVLERGMRWNLNLQRYRTQVNDDELWEIARPSKEDAVEVSKSSVFYEVGERAQLAAMKYASVNLALRYLNVIDQFLPGTLRATIHAKPSQIAAPSLGPVFPWNGVAVMEGEEMTPSCIKVIPIHDASRRYGPLNRGRLLGSSSPFLYTPSR